jgi:hypothetical protein
MTNLTLLPGVSAEYVLARLAKAGGNEIASGKFSNPDSSAALAVNCFAWFADRPHLLPPFPSLEAGYPASLVDIEYQARFPWSGGRHPWLDAVAITESHLVGIESKRFEPSRDTKTVSLSAAYSRDKWGGAMGPYKQLCSELTSGALSFHYLDAAQLVKHAFGLRTQGIRDGKRPVLVYLYAEPNFIGDRPIAEDSLTQHREEVSLFSGRVKDAEVESHSVSYREWIARWMLCARSVIEHGEAVLKEFAP